MKSKSHKALAIIGVMAMLAVSNAGCAPTHQSGLVTDPNTGLQFGSVVEKNIVVDVSQFRDSTLKIRLRNISGDPVFELDGLKSLLERAYAAKGYTITNSNDNALLLDVNVTYSGHASRNMASEYGFLGGAAGGVGGSQLGRNATLGATGGVIVGATLGGILGSYVTDDTYIVVAEATLGVSEPGASDKKKTITFSSSESRKKTVERSFEPFRQTISTGISVYAGGRNVTQQEIAEQVRSRFGSILSDIL